MELEIQKYLRSGESLQDLAWDYDIKFFESHLHPDLVVFDYSLISPKDSQIVREARGLVLEKETWNLVSKSMTGFSFKTDPNYQDIIEKFDWESAMGFPKYDGCLITLYHYKDEWITGTRFSVDGECNVASAYSDEIDLSWNKLFIECIEFIGIDYDELLNNLDKQKTYSFELCSIKNKNIVIYDNKFVKILSIFSHISMSEESLFEDNIFSQIYPVLMPDFVKVDSYQECLDLVESENDPTKNEGMVIIDKYFNRIKLRNKAFDQLSYNLNPTSELEALDNIFYALLDGISPGSSTAISYCYYNINSGLRYCLSSNSSSDNIGPFAECSNQSTCDSLTLYCYIDINNIEFSRCYPAGYVGVPTNFIATGGICGVDPCPNPIMGEGGGGPGPLSVQSLPPGTRLCSTSWDPKQSSKQIDYINLAKTYIDMCNWIMNEFKNYRNGDSSSEILIKSIWPECFNLLVSGKTISEVIMIDSKENQLQAVKSYSVLILE